MHPRKKMTQYDIIHFMTINICGTLKVTKKGKQRTSICRRTFWVFTSWLQGCISRGVTNRRRLHVGVGRSYCPSLGPEDNYCASASSIKATYWVALNVCLAGGAQLTSHTHCRIRLKWSGFCRWSQSLSTYQPLRYEKLR